MAPFDGPPAMTGRFDEAESAMADALSGLAEMQLSAISVYMCRPKRSSETTVRRRSQIAQSDSAPSPSPSAMAMALARVPLDQRRSLGVTPGG